MRMRGYLRMVNTSYAARTTTPSACWNSVRSVDGSSPSTTIRLTFVKTRVNLSSPLLGTSGRLLVERLADYRRHRPNSSRTESVVGKNQLTFQCGKQAAHRRFGAATTTAELEIVFGTGGSQRQCFAVCNPKFRQASNRLHLFGRIVKKLNRARLFRANRPERRVPESDGDRRCLSVFGYETVNVSCAQTPSGAYLENHEQVQTVKKIHRESLEAQSCRRPSAEAIAASNKIRRFSRCEEKWRNETSKDCYPEVGKERRLRAVLCVKEQAHEGNRNTSPSRPHHPDCREVGMRAERPLESSSATRLREHQKKQQSPLKEFRFKPVKGPYEPWYCGIVESETERVLEKWWECPHCRMEFKRRTICEKHCKGEQGMYPPHCHETKKGGKCYSGCGHP